MRRCPTFGDISVVYCAPGGTKCIGGYCWLLGGYRGIFKFLSHNGLAIVQEPTQQSPENVVKCGQFPGIVVKTWSTKTGNYLRFLQCHRHIHPARVVHIF